MKCYLSIGHFLGHIEEQLAIFIVGFAQQSAELVEVTSLFAGGAPGNVVRRLALGQVWQLRGFLTVVEELIKWAFESTGQFFEGFNGRNCVAIFHSRNIAPE